MIDRIPDNMLTTVGHVKSGAPGIYIGRAMPRMSLPGSAFANPFVIGKNGRREEVVEKYRIWLMDQPDLILKAIRELTGRNLLCWCAPHECHGDVLAKVCNLAVTTALGIPEAKKKKATAKPSVVKGGKVGKGNKRRQVLPTTTVGIGPNERIITMADIEQAVSKALGVSPHFIATTHRNPKAIAIREMFVFISREMSHYSFPEIAEYIGKAHSSAIGMIGRVRRRLNVGLRYAWLPNKTPTQVIDDIYRELGVNR